MTSWKSKHVAWLQNSIFICMLCYTDIYKYTAKILVLYLIGFVYTYTEYI
jgi:CRISPR/Cas system-associated endoribonuclease Cas2